MLHAQPTPPPEPYGTAALYLLYHASLFVRNFAGQIGPEQLSDLGEAIDNVPESLTENGHHFDERKIRDNYLATYDREWAATLGSFSLLRTLDAGRVAAEEWQTRARGSLA